MNSRDVRKWHKAQADHREVGRLIPTTLYCSCDALINNIASKTYLRLSATGLYNIQDSTLYRHLVVPIPHFENHGLDYGHSMQNSNDILL